MENILSDYAGFDAGELLIIAWRTFWIHKHNEKVLETGKGTFIAGVPFYE